MSFTPCTDCGLYTHGTGGADVLAIISNNHGQMYVHFSMHTYQCACVQSVCDCTPDMCIHPGLCLFVHVCVSL